MHACVTISSGTVMSAGRIRLSLGKIVGRALSPTQSYIQLVPLAPMPDDADVFDMDSDYASSVSNRDRVDTHSQATTSSHGAGGSEEHVANRHGSIDMCRRAIPVIEADEDICSICLDEFTAEDPGNATVCGHLYHLQCIMQWAQRSRECPMCFKDLQLKDEMMQELLPFGEYVSPERAQPAQQYYMGLEAWELERILARLAVTNGTAQFGTGRRRGHTRAEPVSVNSHHAHDGLKEPVGATSSSVQQDQLSSSQNPASGAGGETSYTASWPPSSSQVKPSSSRSSGAPQDENMQQPSVNGESFKSAAESFKSRWASVSLRCKESISKLSRQTNARWAGKSQQEQPDNTSSSTAA